MQLVSKKKRQKLLIPTYTKKADVLDTDRVERNIILQNSNIKIDVLAIKTHKKVLFKRDNVSSL